MVASCFAPVSSASAAATRRAATGRSAASLSMLLRIDARSNPVGVASMVTTQLQLSIEGRSGPWGEDSRAGRRSGRRARSEQATRAELAEAGEHPAPDEVLLLLGQSDEAQRQLHPGIRPGVPVGDFGKARDRELGEQHVDADDRT